MYFVRSVYWVVHSSTQANGSHVLDLLHQVLGVLLDAVGWYIRQDRRPHPLTLNVREYLDLRFGQMDRPMRPNRVTSTITGLYSTGLFPVESYDESGVMLTII